MLSARGCVGSPTLTRVMTSIVFNKLGQSTPCESVLVSPRDLGTFISDFSLWT